MDVTYTTTQVREVLKALGRSAAKVARALLRGKVRGVRYDPAACPIAVYLARKLEAPFVSVDGAAARVGEGWQSHIVVRLPRAVSTFAYRFDDGQYPKLRRGGSV